MEEIFLFLRADRLFYVHTCLSKDLKALSKQKIFSMTTISISISSLSLSFSFSIWTQKQLILLFDMILSLIEKDMKNGAAATTKIS